MDNVFSMRHDFKKAWLRLLEIKETELRIGILEQAFHAVDKGIHIGGAFSALIPLTAMYYGGYINADISNPTKIGQDIFILSKGHAVAALASIYADLGYFDSSLLDNSRSLESLLNGHPGPILPGIQISTGPLGHGICVAAGFAYQGRKTPDFDVYVMAGDGELQEGMPWEAFMYAGNKKLNNLCLLIDKNNGQLDDTNSLILPIDNIAQKLKSFNWNVLQEDATGFLPVIEAFEQFKLSRGDKPTAIICNSAKGHGGFSDIMNKHKICLSDELYRQEISMQRKEFEKRQASFTMQLNMLDSAETKELIALARKMNLHIYKDAGAFKLEILLPEVKLKKADKRDKNLTYNENEFLNIEEGKEYRANEIIKNTIRVFAKDERIVSIDSDLSSVSGLAEGVGYIDKSRALNVGIAEANMMNMAEAFAVMGCNVWVSTFCPFFNWQVMRRIAIGQEERKEDIRSSSGWLEKGHGLDITFVATAADFDTVTNGATHMGNDDILVFDTVPELKIITASCPRQLRSIMQWIAKGERGLVYLRIMRAPTKAIYSDDYKFEYAKASVIKEGKDIALVSYGRGLYECLGADEILNKTGIHCTVVDMPSLDGETLIKLYQQYDYLFVIEQNNGYLKQNLFKKFYSCGLRLDFNKVFFINTLNSEGKPQFIQSGTYIQLSKKYMLDSESIASTVARILNL